MKINNIRFYRIKWLVRGIVAATAVTVCIKNIDTIEVSSGDTVSTTARYVALGDSIAYGYGLSDREGDSYVGRVEKFLETRYDHVRLKNFAKNGMQSTDLLDALTNPENENYKKYRAQIAYADYITISIGSNDLLHLIKIEPDMESTVLSLQPEFDRACLEFSYKFPAIIREIRKINDKVQIYANNIYNPAKGLETFASVYNLSEYYIGKMNEILGKEEGFHLIDVKEVFDREKDSMINVSLKGRDIDPHPNKEGHKLIAQLIIKEIAQ